MDWTGLDWTGLDWTGLEKDMTRVEQTKRDLLHLETGTQRLRYERGDEAEVSE